MLDQKNTPTRTPAIWGAWLLNKMGFQRQMLNALQSKPVYQGLPGAVQTGTRTVEVDGEEVEQPIYDYSARVGVENKIARRRAKNKVARRSRRINRVHS